VVTATGALYSGVAGWGTVWWKAPRGRRGLRGAAHARAAGAKIGEVGGCQVGPRHSPGRWDQMV
jgi:hypothetical protein